MCTWLYNLVLIATVISVDKEHDYTEFPAPPNMYNVFPVTVRIHCSLNSVHYFENEKLLISLTKDHNSFILLQHVV